jgi:dihydroorotase/N-acyl-D-amino-acid deacylase
MRIVISRLAGRRLYALLIFCCAGIAAAAAQTNEPFDLLLRNGRILDGAGNPWFRGDVAIRGDRIAAVGLLPGAAARRTIDVKQQIVAPGFIDIHNHSEDAMFDVPAGENFIRQGVTSIVEGNDGGSPIPLAPFLEKVAAARIALNVGTFIGHGSVRREILGAADRKATAEELEQMRRLVRQGMEQGALGLSTGLFYIPGAFAPTEEVVELAKVAARYGGMHISHMRDESTRLLDSVRETIRIGEEGGLPTQLTHHKVIGKGNWGQTAESLRLVDEARRRGVDVSVDQYPYTASHTGTGALFPPWAQEGGREKMAERLKDPATRARIKADVAQRIELDRGGGDPANIQFSHCDWDSSLDGKTLADVTRDRGRQVNFENAAETALEIQQAGGCQAVYHAMNEEDVVRVMQYPGTMISTDGGLHVFGEGVPHPRYYGTYPRVLGRYVREKGILRLEDAIRKMTSLPAQRIGQFDRGLIRPGMKADVTVFDPERILDRAEFGRPHQYAEGISYVLVNGTIVLDGGRMTGERPGQLLYGPVRKAGKE